MIPQAMKEASLIPRTMKAVVLTKPAPAEQVRLPQCPTPQARPGWVLVRVKAFGLNHSEQLLRLSEIQEDYIPKPVIPGIECVGEVADASDSCFQNGQRVAALMGGIYGLSDFDPIKQIPNGTYLTGFYSNHPTQEILDAIFRFLEEHRLTPCLGAVFPFSRIQEACAAQDAGTVNGKIVVRVEEAAATGTGRSPIAAK